MKTIKGLTLVLLLTAAGCKDSTDALLAAHASPAADEVRTEWQYSGAGIASTAPRGQVYEYH